MAAAAAICYVVVLILARSNLAGLLAALGAYIAGTVTASYDLAIAAAIAGGFAWRPLVVERLRRWHCLVFGGVVATASALVQGNDPPSNHPPGSPSWTQGFGSGFSDGWTTRADEVVNGWLLSAILAGALLWAAAQSAPRAVDDRGHAPPRIRRFGPAGYGLAVGVVVAAIDSWANGVRPDVTHGWMTGPADGFAVGVAVWCLATLLSPAQQGHPATTADPGHPRHWRPNALHAALLLGAAALLLNGVSYSARTDWHHPWHRAAAESLGVGVIAWFVAHPSRYAITGSRTTGRISLILSAVVVGSTSGYLDAMSAGWSRGVITGLSGGLILLYARLRIQTGDPDGAMRNWLTRPLDAGVLVTVVYGLAAGFAYGLLVGIIFGLAVQVARDVSGRHFPSRGFRVSWPGAIGGAVLGTLAAVAAGFSGVTVAWLVPIGLTSGAAAAITFGAQGITVPDDVVMSPQRLLRLDRVTFVVVLAIVAVAHSLATSTRAVAAGSSASIGVLAAVSTFLTYGLTAGLLIATAQARYGTLLLWGLIYAARGQLPWRLMTFLDAAHRRGILRQNGATYQFRHQFLQDRIVDAVR